MSTILYLTCEDHDPPLRADSESGQHLSDLPQVRDDIAERESLLAERDAVEDTGATYTTGSPFRDGSVRFMAEHRKCRIGIVDEYGRAHEVTDRGDDVDGTPAAVNEAMPAQRVQEIRQEVERLATEYAWAGGLRNVRSPMNGAETLALLDRLAELEEMVRRA